MSVIRKQSILGSIIAIIGVVLGFVNSGYLQPMLLEVATIGMLRVMLSIASVTTVIASFGFNVVLVKYYPKALLNNQTKDILKLYFGVTSIGLLIGVLGVFCYVSFIQRQLSQAFLFSTLAVFVFYFLFSSIGILLNVLGKVNYVLFIKDILIKFLFVGLLLFVMLSGKSMDWFLHSIYGIYALAVFCLLINLTISLKISNGDNQRVRLKKEGLKPMLKLGFFSFLSASTVIFIKELDILMVTELINVEATGVYAIMLFFATLVSIPSRALIGISIIKIGQAWSDNNRKFLSDLYYKTSNNQLFVAGIVMVLLNANVLVVLDLMPNGFKFEDGIWVMFWLSLAQFIDMASGVSGQILYYSDKYRNGFYFSIILLISLIVFNIYFIPKYGINGAAFATFLSQLINNFLRWVFLKKHYQLQPFDSKFIAGFVLIILLLVFAIWFRVFANAVSDLLAILIMNGIILSIFMITLTATDIAPDLKERVFVYLKKLNINKK